MMSSERKYNCISVLMGGPSSEREVSLCSGKAVASGLREAGYEVFEVDVKEKELDLPGNTEAVFIALHGEYGEDGDVQARLEAMGMPYAGSGVESSRASFDKIESKRVFVDNNIPTPDFEVLKDGDERKMPLPVVVKPPKQGSSIGITRVFEEDQWGPAMQEALKYDDTVLVEKYIEGRELTVGVVANESLPVVEIVAPGDWYSYKAKYTKGETRYLVPAPVSEETADLCRDLSLKIFKAFECSGFGRADFRMSEDGSVFALEMNSIPGFTETSLLPKAAAAMGISFSELCSRIIDTID